MDIAADHRLGEHMATQQADRWISTTLRASLRGSAHFTEMVDESEQAGEDLQPSFVLHRVLAPVSAQGSECGAGSAEKEEFEFTVHPGCYWLWPLLPFVAKRTSRVPRKFSARF
jgi:hypothetical protein